MRVERVVLQRAGVGGGQAAQSSESGGITGGAHSDARHYTLAILSVRGPSSASASAGRFAVTRGGSERPLSQSRVHGLTRLVCVPSPTLPAGGRGRKPRPRVFESFTRPNRLRRRPQAENQRGRESEEGETESAPAHSSSPPPLGPAAFLVPLHGLEANASLGSLHPVYSLLSPPPSPGPTGAANDDVLRFGLLLDWTSSPSSSPSSPSSQSTTLTLRELKSSRCEVRFIPPENQVSPALRGGEPDDGEERGGAEGAQYSFAGHPLSGAVRVDFLLDDDDDQGDEGEAEVELASSVPATHVWAAVKGWAYPHTADRAGARDTEEEDPWPSAHAGSSAEEAAFSECSFDPSSDDAVFLESDARVYGTVASQARGMMAGVLAPVVAAVEGTFDSVVGGFVLNAATEFMPGGVADGIVSQVTRQLPPMIARLLIPSIGASLAASLPPATVKKIEPYASHGISYKTSHDIVESLSRNLVRNIHELVDIELPKSLAVLHGAIVPQLLDRSVTHSVVAALTHSLAHSPLHDSFCTVCAQHKKQCEFCHFNEQRVFFSLYYAGYYSSYYSSYYREYFTHISSEDRIRAIETAQHRAQDRLRYRRVFSDRTEEGSHTIAEPAAADDKKKKPK